MKVLIIDLETTGLDEDTCSIIEVGASVLCTSSKTIIWSHSAILPYVGPNPAEHINKISVESLQSAIDLEGSCPLATIQRMAQSEKIDAVGAHNAEFEKKFLRKHSDWWLGVSWFCTLELLGKGLDAACIDKDIPVVHPMRHRALYDVWLTCECLCRTEDVEDKIAYGMLPKSLFAACISFSQNHLAKAAGFRFRSCENNSWVKAMPRETCLEPSEDRPFRLRKLRDL